MGEPYHSGGTGPGPGCSVIGGTWVRVPGKGLGCHKWFPSPGLLAITDHVVVEISP